MRLEGLEVRRQERPEIDRRRVRLQDLERAVDHERANVLPVGGHQRLPEHQRAHRHAHQRVEITAFLRENLEGLEGYLREKIERYAAMLESV